MRSGRLRHRVTIQHEATSMNGYGENAGTWSDVATVWAAVEPVSGKEAFSGGQNMATQAVRVVMRYRAGVTPQMRLVNDGITYNIEAVVNRDERNRELELMCVRGQASG